MNTYCSDEQMRIIGLMGGRDGFTPWWEPVPLPEGRQPLPDWALDLDVDFLPQYVNPPTVKLKTDRQLRECGDKRFTRSGDRYLAVSSDGRGECYYQAGEPSLAKLRRFRATDGTLSAYRPERPGLSNIITAEEDFASRLVPGEWVEVERLATPQQHGFGGAHYDLILDDGTEITLRGPWAGPTPEGFVDVGYVNTSERYYRGRPWRGLGGCGGLLIAEDVFVRIFARYQPHLLLARVDEGIGPRLQAYTHEWGEPKVWHRARARREG